MAIHAVANILERKIANQEVQHPPETGMEISTSTIATPFASPPPSPSTSPPPPLSHSSSRSSPHASSALTSPLLHPHFCSSQPIPTPHSPHLPRYVMQNILSRRLQALLTLLTVGIAIYIGFANGTRTTDPAQAPPPPGHHGQSTQSCPEVGTACSPELKVGIQDTNLGMEERVRCLQCMQTAQMRACYANEMRQHSGGMKAVEMVDMEMGGGKVQEKLASIEKWQLAMGRMDRIEHRVEKIEERLASIETTMNNNFQTLLQKLDDRRGDHEQGGGAQESKMDGQESEKASVELKSRDSAATVHRAPASGFVIGFWVTVVVYVLYCKEWVARRERRWRLRDELRAKHRGCVLM